MSAGNMSTNLKKTFRLRHKPLVTLRVELISKKIHICQLIWLEEDERKLISTVVGVQYSQLNFLSWCIVMSTRY